jgi:hypothetical protein
MAKTLLIRSPEAFANPPAIDSLIIPPTETRLSLGALALAILAGSVEAMSVVIDMTARTIHARPVGALDPLAMIQQQYAEDINQVSTVQQVEDARTSEWITAGAANPRWGVTDSETGNLVELMLRPDRPRLTVSTLISRIEDAMVDLADPLALAGDVGLIVIDQQTERVSFLALNANAYPAVLTMFNVGQPLADSIRYEQVFVPGADVIPAQAFE